MSVKKRKTAAEKSSNAPDPFDFTDELAAQKTNPPPKITRILETFIKYHIYDIQSELGEGRTIDFARFVGPLAEPPPAEVVENAKILGSISADLIAFTDEPASELDQALENNPVNQIPILTFHVLPEELIEGEQEGQATFPAMLESMQRVLECVGGAPRLFALRHS